MASKPRARLYVPSWGLWVCTSIAALLITLATKSHDPSMIQAGAVFCDSGESQLPCRHPHILYWYYMGGCQNCGPFLGALNFRYRTILGTITGTMILTTTHMAPSNLKRTGNVVHDQLPTYRIPRAEQLSG